AVGQHHGLPIGRAFDQHGDVLAADADLANGGRAHEALRPMAALTRGITCVAISSMERWPSALSFQSWQAYSKVPKSPICSRNARICSTTLSTVPAITSLSVTYSGVISLSGWAWSSLN